MKKRCSFVPDHNKEVHTCCELHDTGYSSGSDSRVSLDSKFRQCIISSGHPVLAWVYWIGVRLFGWAFYK